jgi:hypothetical protein
LERKNGLVVKIGKVDLVMVKSMEIKEDE